MTDPLLRMDPLRLRHVHGERLRGRDAAEQSDQNDQRRWWHNRGVHRAYGIVTGLDVTVADGLATVAPGLAYDRRGRELLLATSRRVPVPAGHMTPSLVLAWRADGARLCWLPPDAAPCDGVRLGVADGTGPPPVRPVARPRIGRGATLPGATAWEPWVQTAADRELALGIQVVVDTSASGFTAPPCYFAQLTGSTWDARLPLMLLVPFDHIAQQGRDRFTFRLLMPWLYVLQGLTIPERLAAVSRPDFGETFRGLAQITDLAVTWIGIQHRTGGQP